MDHPPGFINAGSLNCNLGQLAHQIAEVWGAKVIDDGNSETYSFLLDTSLMKSICRKELKPRDFSQVCHDFFEKMEFSNG